VRDAAHRLLRERDDLVFAMRPANPRLMPRTSQPRLIAERAAARMTAFRPGASPPPVEIAMRICVGDARVTWGGTCHGPTRPDDASARIRFYGTVVRVPRATSQRSLPAPDVARASTLEDRRAVLRYLEPSSRPGITSTFASGNCCWSSAANLTARGS
jgi:hypothetical protein